MSYTHQNLQQVLAECHYDQNTKKYLYNEQMHILQVYQMSFKPVLAKLPSGSFKILEVLGTIPVNFKGNTYNIPIKLHYLPGYPACPPVLIVNPSPEMMIRASQYVQQDGKANFAILNEWSRNYNTLMVLDEAKRIFSAEMPVFKKPKNPMPDSSPGNFGVINGVQPDPRFSAGNKPNSVNQVLNGYSSVQPKPISTYPGSNLTNSASNPSLPQSGYQSIQPRQVTSYPGSNLNSGPSNPSLPQPGYQSIQPRQVSSYPNSNLNSGPSYSSLPQSGYQSVQPRQVSSYPPAMPGYSAQSPGYSSVLPAQSSGYVTQPDMRVLVQNSIPPPNITKSINYEKIKKVYKSTIDSLSTEISVLKTESETLSSNSFLITTSLNSFKSEIQSGQSKLDIIKANIKNTEDWIALSSSSNLTEINYEGLIEFRNNEAKYYLELSCQERSLESTIQVIIEGIQKSTIPAKESLLLLKQLYIDLFILTRLKEKTKKLSLQSN